MANEENVYFGVKEIAKRANVSIATVDRVIHNRTGVSEKTRNKINAIIKEMDYQPNILASRLASRKPIHFSILIPHSSKDTRFWEAPLLGINRAEKELKSYGIQLKYYYFDLNDRASFVRQSDLLLSKDLDGLLYSPVFVDEAVQLASACDRREVPYVFIDADLPEAKKLSYIGPHLFQSGFVGAKLLTYRTTTHHPLLIVNISKSIENNNSLTIAAGIRSYIENNGLSNQLVTVDIQDTDSFAVARHLTQVLHDYPKIDGIFVTNSRVSAVAAFLAKKKRPEIRLIGYDFLKENCQYLQEGLIDFLICHKPEEQGYRGIMALYQNVVVDAPVDKMQYMPIDIITTENMDFYGN